MSMMRVDLIIDTAYTEAELLEIVTQKLGEIALYSIDKLKATSKEEAVDEMTRL